MNDDRISDIKWSIGTAVLAFVVLVAVLLVLQ